MEDAPHDASGLSSTAPPWDERAGARAAVGSGHLTILEWLQSQTPPCPLGEGARNLTTINGHLEVLQWLKQQSPSSSWGHLEVLLWLKQQDPSCPWDERVCFWAAHDGRLEVLRWLRSRDPPCSWDAANCCAAAAANGHAAVVAWIEEATAEPDVKEPSSL